MRPGSSARADGPGKGLRPMEVHRLGLVPYLDALAIQKDLVDRRKAGDIPDLLLLLQHPPVITLGVKSRNARTNVLEAPDRLAERGIDVVDTGRGGDVTYR